MPKASSNRSPKATNHRLAPVGLGCAVTYTRTLSLIFVHSLVSVLFSFPSSEILNLADHGQGTMTRNSLQRLSRATRINTVDLRSALRFLRTRKTELRLLRGHDCQGYKAGYSYGLTHPTPVGPRSKEVQFTTCMSMFFQISLSHSSIKLRPIGNALSTKGEPAHAKGLLALRFFRRFIFHENILDFKDLSIEQLADLGLQRALRFRRNPSGETILLQQSF